MYLVDEFDNLKTKILKYILYKPKTEYEVRNKFSDKYDKVVLEDVIKWLKKEKYIDDNENINLIIADYLENKNFSVKELIYNLNLKGISYENIEEYCTLNKINLDLYEYNSAENIVQKKSNLLNKEQIKKYLLNKGYSYDIIKKINKNEGKKCQF